MKIESAKRHCRHTFALVCLVTMLVTAGAYAQSSSGSVRGTVRDQSDAVVPNATVVLTGAATNSVSNGVTNEAGSYVFPSVIPGDYRIAIASAGLQKYEASITVRVQQSTTIDAVLKVASETATVAVTDATPEVV